ncbi:MAG: hypothetical protein HRT57_03405 [Crocinitomicaceae bacterium]|nr:hypothetical protein [Crocinitomicaceae bacterium]
MKNVMILILLLGLALPSYSQNELQEVSPEHPCAELTIIGIGDFICYHFVSNTPYSACDLAPLKEYLLNNFTCLEGVWIEENSLYVTIQVSRFMKRPELLGVLSLFKYSDYRVNM